MLAFGIVVAELATSNVRLSETTLSECRSLEDQELCFPIPAQERDSESTNPVAQVLKVNALNLTAEAPILHLV